MKKLAKKVIVMSCVALFGIGISNAQKIERKKEHKKERTEFVQSLSPAQKTQFKNINALNKQNREALKATYSKEQLAIKKNKDLPRKEKREAFKATLSKSQKALIKKQRATIKSKRENFRASLTDAQKKQFIASRRGGHKKGKKTGKRKRRA